MQRLLLLVTVVTWCLACQRDLSPGQIGKTLGPEIQRFTITTGRDTLVRCKGGMVLRFCPNTFLCKENKFTLEVQEVRDRGEAFLLGISTLAADGRLLETEGMLYLNGTNSDGSAVSINPDCPIQLEIPVKGRRVGAKWFKGKIDNGLAWEEIPGGLENQADIHNLETGQQLFKTLCSDCHCEYLNSPLTGPALGNITQFRDTTWLRQFTRNSQGMIGSGDPLALCLWEKWKPVMMSSFSQLSDKQIDAIYQYITEESARSKVRLDSADYVCVRVKQTVNTSVVHQSSPRSLLAPVPDKSNPYFVKIYEMGWHNCDMFVNDSTTRPAVVKLKVDHHERYDEILAGILFRQLNANITLENYGGGQFTIWQGEPVPLPQTAARLVVIAIQGKNWFKYEQPFTVGAHNEFKATLEAASDKQMKIFIQDNGFRLPVIDTTRYCLQTQ